MTEDVKPENPVEDSPEQTEDFAGYPSLEAMKQGIYESRKAGKAQAEVIAKQQAQLTQLMHIVQNGNKSEVKSALQEINDLGLPAETFREAVKAVAREELTSELTPMHKTQEAVATLRASHPTFAKSEAEFNRWLLGNPDVADEFNAGVTKAPESAKRLLMGVYAEYEATRKAGPAEKPTVPAGARLSGGSRGPTAGGSRKPDGDQPKMSEDDFLKAVQRARATGDVVSLIRAMKGDKPIHRDFAQKD